MESHTSLFELVGICCLCYLFANVSPLPGYMKKALNWTDKRFSPPVYKRLKPFDCAYCLAFWVNLCYFYLNNDPMFLAYAGIGSMINYTALHVFNTRR